MIKALAKILLALSCFSLPAFGQISAIWNGPPPSLNCPGPAIGIDIVTPNLYICGRNAQGVNQWTIASGSGTPTVPISPNGVPQFLSTTPSGGIGGAPTWGLSGVGSRTTACPTGNTDTILATDRNSYVVWNDSSACTVNLPQVGSAGFISNFGFLGCNFGAGTATITPATSTISWTDGTATTHTNQISMPIAQGQCAWIFTASDGANYSAILRAAGGSGFQVFRGICQGVISSNSSNAISPVGLGGNPNNGACAATSAENDGSISTRACTLKNLFVHSGAAGVNASDGVITLQDNASATTITCTLGTGTSCNDSTHTASVAAGDLIWIIGTSQTSSTLATISISAECQ